MVLVMRLNHLKPIGLKMDYVPEEVELDEGFSPKEIKMNNRYCI